MGIFVFVLLFFSFPRLKPTFQKHLQLGHRCWVLKELPTSSRAHKELYQGLQEQQSWARPLQLARARPALLVLGVAV